MSQESFDYFEDGNWEDRAEPEWAEGDWRQYLNTADKEVVRFMGYYRRFRRFPDHLDLTAHLMGWSTAEWEPDEAFLKTAVGKLFAKLERNRGTQTEYDQPLSAHRHPVYIASRGLLARLRMLWDSQLRNGMQSREDAVFGWTYGNTLGRAEVHAVHGAQALDMGDLELAICHFKDLLASVNDLLRMVQSRIDLKGQKFGIEGIEVLFDLREVALRVLSECREDLEGENCSDPDED
ncbi:MAG: hypothetical protein ACFCU4_04830 [Puniceicoccaceae bacterium]